MVLRVRKAFQRARPSDRTWDGPRLRVPINVPPWRNRMPGPWYLCVFRLCCFYRFFLAGLS